MAQTLYASASYDEALARPRAAAAGQQLATSRSPSSINQQRALCLLALGRVPGGGARDCRGRPGRPDVSARRRVDLAAGAHGVSRRRGRACCPASCRPSTSRLDDSTTPRRGTQAAARVSSASSRWRPIADLDRGADRGAGRPEDAGRRIRQARRSCRRAPAATAARASRAVAARRRRQSTTTPSSTAAEPDVDRAGHRASGSAAVDEHVAAGCRARPALLEVIITKERRRRARDADAADRGVLRSAGARRHEELALPSGDAERTAGPVQEEHQDLVPVDQPSVFSLAWLHVIAQMGAYPRMPGTEGWRLRPKAEG